MNTFGSLESARFVRLLVVIEVFMRAAQDLLLQLGERIREEYRELPGLSLTKPQVQRLWDLDASLCDVVLDALEAARVLRRTERGTYVGTC
jgi:hypothetical protein